MDFSPKLKRVMAQIKDILQKEDLGGMVVLHTPGYSEYLLNLTPSYSCLKVEKDQIRVLSKLTDYDGDQKQQIQHQANTANMLSLITETAVNQTRVLMQVSNAVDVVVGAEHGKLRHRPHGGKGPKFSDN
ncbi:hypothetical protein [Runella salmonicolor]|uniref:Uncharacterized protein n=1 Tax=Runella salmonicolor TaxID=2950278 RepID=A0ABT1FTP3_9BACT|nr:hypothetical protein [Runella salmonicolor]MCP1384860.1 hypothetical protein [Runella salmonicolor]